MITEKKQIKLKDICLDVVYKDIKNVHLSVYPPTGRVRISAPLRMNMDTLRVFAISKLSWIKKQQNKFLSQGREAPREYVTRESHYFLGKRYLLKVEKQDISPKVEVKHETIEMRVRPDSGVEKRREILNEWYRQSLKEIVPGIIAKYEKLMSVKVCDFGIKKMKTRWGTCSRDAKRIWLNLELAKKPKYYIEYIILHEMVHLLERCHNKHFVGYMDKFMPQWRQYKEELSQIILSHERWSC